ncbi:glutaredoxin [Paenibacillus curdlanolyticus YK9]|uniref:Glutaredoxin n=1 Tax=Paenibacillus curdlanolyticus YK9 TaxID=717606 RepID=E0I7X5_9BACL|nr:glutaredoxin family protein [Paenibacillus curdlanolyticus]EFM11280.1 glutaredoxin [Paenibacillus curdlanolyticus YK9]
MSSNQKVVLWSKTGCHHCAQVKSLLEANNIAYENVSVDNNDALRDVLEVKYGIRYVPVVEVGGAGKFEAWTDLDLEHLQTLVGAVKVG